MADIGAIREGIRANLDTIPSLRTSAFLPGQINTPHAIVLAPSIAFDSTMQRGSDEYQVPVVVLISQAYNRAAEQQLDDLNDGSANSVKAAIEADVSLGGAADTVRVVSMDQPGEIEVAGVAYYGARYTVEVVA